MSSSRSAWYVSWGSLTPANVREQRNGTAVPCFVTTLLDAAADEKNSSKDTTVDPNRDFDIRWAANSMYSASIDTTITVVQHFILAMLRHPHVLAAAQDEMDRVVGSGRLPSFEDRQRLPYLECVMSEVLRWGVPVPMGTYSATIYSTAS